MRRLLQIILALFAILAPSTMWAYDFEVDGIFYYYTGQASVAVTSGPTQYSGDVTIPAAVTYNGTAFPVIGIDTWAFTGCSDLASVTIPSTVVSIDIILRGDYTSAADVNSDGEVNIADINALIDIILNGGATSRVNCTPKV